ncbi:hypothetical protein HHK36_004532 [Tetracentron sinense]|uniref:Uncharacterized protein n=1 Tax=Tetracentron sinense TaxID=13715 RepID=A0A834ZQ73_TETSI|nr:hypothetical protein HHK36_004516 [Tetracentron sinense]KAF8411974.1 hypothetical protein HHK36_004532 [Tetracentron sinense]
MEENMITAISNLAGEVIAEGLDSISSSSHPCHPCKHRIDDYMEVSSSIFKGVFLQQNGNWGAQIYANNQQICLGTFETEEAAAMAYDSAAIKLQGGDSYRNFPWTEFTIQEPNFQDLHTTEAVLNMIKDGSYQSLFIDFIKSRPSIGSETRGRVNEGGVLCQQIFRKELTQSDVGKLKGLVIPKEHALTFFPLVPDVRSKGDKNEGEMEAIQQNPHDKQLKSWKFRYCYQKNSESFVLKKGWYQFVKENGGKAKDIISFYRCEYRDDSKDRMFCMINIQKSNSKNNGVFVGRKMELQPGFGRNIEYGSDGKGKSVDEQKKKGVRLFGIEIS